MRLSNAKFPHYILIGFLVYAPTFSVIFGILSIPIPGIATMSALATILIFVQIINYKNLITPYPSLYFFFVLSYLTLAGISIIFDDNAYLSPIKKITHVII